MHPVSSIVRASELHQQEIAAEAAYDRLCQQAAGDQPRATSGSLMWVLPATVVIVVVVVLALIAAAAGGDPAFIAQTIARGF